MSVNQVPLPLYWTEVSKALSDESALTSAVEEAEVEVTGAAEEMVAMARAARAAEMNLTMMKDRL